MLFIHIHFKQWVKEVGQCGVPSFYARLWWWCVGWGRNGMYYRALHTLSLVTIQSFSVVRAGDRLLVIMALLSQNKSFLFASIIYLVEYTWFWQPDRRVWGSFVCFDIFVIRWHKSQKFRPNEYHIMVVHYSQ